MKRLCWVHQPEMALVAGGQQEAIREQLHKQGWDIRLIPYRPRMMWREQHDCDLLVWSFIPTQLDLWSTRPLAREQMGVIHELSGSTATLPSLQHWIVPSNALREQLCGRGVHPGQVSVVDAVPTRPNVSARSLRVLLGLPESAPVIYAGGPLIPQAGGRLAVWAVNILNYSHPEARIILHGNGIERERLEAFIQSVDQRQRCHFLPECYPVAEAVHQADQIWLPRQWDGVPDLLFHALNCGKPILASDVPSMREWLVHERNALILPMQQPPSWAAAANKLLEQPAWAETLGEAARQTRTTIHSPKLTIPGLPGMVERELHQVA